MRMKILEVPDNGIITRLKVEVNTLRNVLRELDEKTGAHVHVALTNTIDTLERMITEVSPLTRRETRFVVWQAYCTARSAYQDDMDFGGEMLYFNGVSKRIRREK